MLAAIVNLEGDSGDARLRPFIRMAAAGKVLAAHTALV